MDKETFSSYGWIVITVIVIGIMILFATPFGQHILTSVENILKSFQSTAESLLSDPAVSITIG